MTIEHETRFERLIGRESEIALLGAAVANGPGAVVVGDVGVGKSSLARVVGAGLAEAGAHVESVLATTAASVVPFGALAPLLPTGATAGTDVLDVLTRTGEELARAHANRTVVVIVDDAHRLDPASAALILQLAVRQAVRVLAIVRQGEHVPDAVTALWKDLGALRLDLEALAPEDAMTLVRSLLGGPIERRTASWLYDVTRGNPLYLRELAVSACAAGGLVERRGHWQRVESHGLARRLIELIDVRIGDLDPTQRRAMGIVALAEPVAVELVERLAGSAAAQGLERRGLVVLDGEAAVLRCAHPLYGEAVRTQLGALEAGALRSELSPQLARDEAATRLTLAVWALEGGETDDAELLAAATRDALEAFDPPLAVRLGRAALAAGARGEAVLALAKALRATGDFQAAEELLEHVEPDIIGTEHMADYVFIRAGGLQWGLGRVAESLGFVERAAGWTDHPLWRTATEGIAAAMCATCGRLTEAVARGERVLAAPECTPQARVGAGVAVGYALAQLGRPRAAVEATRRARRLAGPDAEAEWPLEVIAALAAIAAGEGWDDAEAAVHARHTRALEQGDHDRATLCEVGLSALADARGNLADLHRYAADAFTRLAFFDPRGMATTSLAGMAGAAAGRGDARGAHDALRRAWKLAADRPPDAIGAFSIDIAQVKVEAAQGNLQTAQDLALAAARAAGEAVMWEAEALHEYARAGGAAHVVDDRLREIARDASPSVAELWAREAAAARRRSGAELEAVAAEYAAVGARLWAAETAAQAAGAYAAEGRADSSRRAQARASRLAEACGGARTTLLGAVQVEGLSAREREIAGLVARGLSNPEIAKRLSLSVRTVESHIYRATIKLGVRSRSELAEVAAPIAAEPG